MKSKDLLAFICLLAHQSPVPVPGFINDVCFLALIRSYLDLLGISEPVHSRWSIALAFLAAFHALALERETGRVERILKLELPRRT